MRQLDRYLLRSLCVGFIAAAALLLPLFGTLDLVEELDDLQEGGYRLAQALTVVLFTLPRRAVELGPFIALLGGIAALGQLAVTQELTVMRAAGVSMTRIGLAVLMAGVLLALVLAATDEWVASPLQQKALRIRTLALAMTDDRAGKDHSIWAMKENQVVRIGGLDSSQLPNQIEIFTFEPNHALSQYIQAQRAEVQAGNLWQLHEVTVKRWAGDQETVERLDIMRWQSFVPANRLSEVSLPPESLSFVQLNRYVDFLQRTGQPAGQYQVALWQKLGNPILTLAMILFAVPFTFGQSRSTGLAGKLAVGALVGLLVYMVNQILVNLGILLKLNPLAVGILPAAVLLGAAMLVVARYDRSAHG
ncbi:MULTISPECIES: LPS export ABC transporter permease LptG [Pseudomonadaceae]|uniref:LPS export ABC transporter permease LptG n=2 Tax=Stutzerimonas stutzeri group TaxID=136846 RepID=A0A9X1N680_9GAMM|nr:MULTISPECIES: LPS export ABC transporter permease LptG [Pseudomonadaceae]MBB60422.1 LPS export ABC transporter permease LptG [Pseudomonas sp.]MBP2697836.1 LPS export ABC transporter permease LptG [Pseudomonas aeruginosa]MCD1610545.1 LPS export ABC transporter permease LptG [Stutzerimonas kunmingensis]QTB75907.1 LPS export ABC transporter permease LptG [Pseudomonas aeruginosa]QTB88047.1 LPS export ABC transporter permease LptG [Pseudomonas aeruginosa]|tara:strand:- start:502 stop:1587 length:1086 start_codon:yes stop_codon:yes gene_type:complete